VTISDTTPGANIYYTTNGTTPTTSSSVYSSPITVSASETLEAIAVATGYSNSAVGSAVYAIGSGSTGGGSTSTHVTLTVSPGLTVPSGTTLQLTGSISPSTSGANTATGTISFYDSGTLLGSASVSGGQASISISSLAPGSHSISASYSGDGNFSTSSAATWPGTITVNSSTATVLPAYGYIDTVAGWGGGHDYNGNNIPATGASIQASGVAVDQYGNFYIADTWNTCVQKVTTSTGIITTVAGLCGDQNYGYNGDDIPATSAQLYTGRRIAVDANGNVFIADDFNNRIRVVYAGGTIPNVSNPTVGYIYTIAGTGGGGFNGDNQLATNAELYAPGAIALDASGNVYIADTDNERVRVVYVAGTIPNVTNPTMGYIYTVAGTGASGYNGDDQLATSAKLNLTIYAPGETQPGVAVDGYGNIYIADNNNNRVRAVYSGGSLPNVLSPTVGSIYTVAGTGAGGYNGDNQLAIVAELTQPSDVAVDASGNIYIADTFNNRVREVTNGQITTVAGNGGSGYNGDNILAIDADLNLPWGVAVDASGNIYIADMYNYRIRAVGGIATTTSTFEPLYKVVSILYSPPGNQSTQGYSTSTTNGTTTTVGSSFTFGNVATFSTGIKNIFTAGGSIGYSQTNSNSYAFTETFTNTTALTTSDNNSTFNASGSNAINHNLDTFEIWLNSLVTFQSNGDTPVTYTTSSTPITVNGVPLPIADILGVPAITMEASPAGVTTLNPSGAAGVTTVPEDLLAPIRIPQDSGVNAYMPGLGAVCANNQPYLQELAADLAAEAQGTNRTDSYCTQTNQCGCAPADFAGILETNPLLNYNSTTFTASPYAGTVSPLQADSLPTSSGPGSGPTACGLNTVLTTSNCRYVVVPLPGTNTKQTATENAVPLTELMEGGIQAPAITINDSSTTAETIGGSTSNSVSVSVGGGPLVANLKYQGTWTWTDTQSVGNSYGSANSMSVTLKSSTVACDEEVSIYEDTEYHTLVFQVPANVTGCN
jgi:hypothetical protein